jgi:shikimate dehydrogenase
MKDQVNDCCKYPFLISGNLYRIGLVGGTAIEHYSIAKEVWTQYFHGRGLPIEFFYLPIGNIVELSRFMNNLRHESWLGVNVALPWKELVIPYLDVLDNSCSDLGLVNCIVSKNGKLTGFNTDGIGFVSALEQQGYCLDERTSLIIGAGGCGRAIAWQLAQKSAAAIHFLDMDSKKGIEAVYSLERSNFSVNISCGNKTSLCFNLVVNCSGVGAHLLSNENAIPTNFDNFCYTEECLFTETIYNPIVTAFLEKASHRGVAVQSGASMLGCQAFYSMRAYESELVLSSDLEYFISLANAAAEQVINSRLV